MVCHLFLAEQPTNGEQAQPQTLRMIDLRRSRGWLAGYRLMED